jgi:hypothetical protein
MIVQQSEFLQGGLSAGAGADGSMLAQINPAGHQ